MNKFSYILLWAAGFLVQTILAPLPLAPMLIVPLVVLLYLGIDRNSVLVAVALSILGELTTLTPLGSILIPVLACAGILRLAHHVIDVKPLDRRESWNLPHLGLMITHGAVLLLIALVLQTFFVWRLYANPLWWVTVFQFLGHIELLAYNIGLLVVFLFLFRLMRRTQTLV